MDEKAVYIENLGIGLSSYSNLYALDLDNDEYLVVGQRANQDINLDTKNIKYNFIVNNQGIGINATRNEVMKNAQSGLYISDDITCKGRIITNSIEIQGVSVSGDIDNPEIFRLINALTSNNIFYEGYSNIDIQNVTYDNKYTTSYLTLGGYSATYSNLHPLNIVHSGNNSIENNHICIQNDINITDDENPLNNESCKFTMGIIGNAQNSPAVITTTKNMDLEFHVSKTSSVINQLYISDTGIPDYTNNIPPAIIIKPNNIVGINTSIIESFKYNTYSDKNLLNTPSLDVEGMAYINTICIYDYNLKEKRSLDDIFVRRDGLTLKANQIIGGEIDGIFKNGPYTFDSDLFIGKNCSSSSKLTIYNKTEICGDLSVDNLTVLHGNLITCGIVSFSNVVDFYNPVYFKNDMSVDSNLTINVGGNLFVDNIRINVNVDSHTGINTISYANDNFNISGTNNIVIGGRLGVGVTSGEPYINQLTVSKHNSPYFEFLLQDFQNNSPDISKVYMGHKQQLKTDNSFIIFTQKTRKEHNIYFYPGKDLNDFNLLDLIPTLAIMQNNKVGINTKTPQKTLDVSGDILANNYYTKDSLNNIVQTKSLININNDIILPNIKSFNININQLNTYNNPKMLNILGGINSYDGYYINNNQICPIFYNSSSSAILKINLGIGVSENVSVPLQIRNINLNKNNNSILRFYRGKKSGNFEALYSGIDICDYDTQIPTYDRNNFKWYIYKYHIDNFNNNQIGPLQIGYTHNTYNPTKSAINIYYDKLKSYHIDINKPSVDYNYNKDAAMSIYGDLEVFGNINIIGANNYKYNGVNVGDFSIISSTLESQQIEIPLRTNQSVNDISLIGNKLILLSTKTTIIGYRDSWIINDINTIGSQNNPLDNIPLYVYQNNYNTSSSKFYSTNFYKPNSPDISKIEFGLIDISTTTGSITNKIELSLKGYKNDTTAINVFEIIPSSSLNNSFISFVQNDSILYTHIGSSQNSYNSTTGLLIYNDTSLHVDDNSKYLLKLTNQTYSPAINFHKKIDENDHNWHLKGPDKIDDSFNINYESTKSTIIGDILITSNHLLKITPEGFYHFNSNVSQNFTTNNTININSIYNKSSLLLTNNYNSHQLYNNNNNIFITNTNKLKYTTNTLKNNNSDDIIINNYFKYYIEQSNLPSNDINGKLIIEDYYVNNSEININKKYLPTPTINYTYNDILVNYNYTTFTNYKASLNSDKTILTKYISLLPTIINTYNNKYTYSIDNNSQDTLVHNDIFNSSTEILTYNITYTYPNNNDINIIEINNQYIVNNSTSNIYYNAVHIYYYTAPPFNEIYLTSTIILEDYCYFDSTLNGITKTNVYFTCNIIKYNRCNDINISLLNIQSTNDIYVNNNIIAPVSIIDTNNIIGELSGSIEIINNNNNIITLNNSYSFIKNILDDYQLIPTTLTLPTNNFEYFFKLDINNSQKIIVTGNIQINNSYTIYDSNYPDWNIKIPIYYNNYQPHITLRNYVDIDNYQFNNIHKIYSYNGNLDFYLDNTKLLSLDNTGNANIAGNINTNNLTVTGDIFDKYGNSIMPDLNSAIYTIKCDESYEVTSPNVNFINSSGFNIIRTNENIVNTNLFEIDGGNNEDANFITLNSSTNGSLIHFTSLYNNNLNFCIYRAGIKDNTFGIWMNKNNLKSESNYINGTLNSFDYYNDALNITYNNNNQNFDFIINGNINLNNSIKFIDTINSSDIIKINANSHYGIEIFNNIYAHKDIKVDGNLLTSSDKRFKNDIIKIDNALNKLIKLNGVIYTSSLTNEKNSGLIAQEVLEVLPEVVKNDSNDYLTIAYGNMMGLVIEAIKELKCEIDYIKSKI